MSDAKEKAQAAALKYRNDDRNSRSYADYYEGYLAGHAEAMRLRDSVKEPPPDRCLLAFHFSNGEVVAGMLGIDREWCVIMRNAECRYPVVELYALKDFAGWRPIGPIPEVKV